MNKLNCNIYVINLLRDYGISCIFNVNDLVDYKSFDCSPLIVELSPKPFFERPLFTRLSDTHLITTTTVDKVLEDETIITKTGGTHRYLHCCKRKAPIVDSQLDQGDLQKIDPVQHRRPNPSKLDGVEFSPTPDIYSRWRTEELNPRSPSPSWSRRKIWDFLYFCFFSFFI